jgi:arabinose-5-phosphate isomerase
MSRARLGMTAVVDAADRLVGIFTDGDLRRSLEQLIDLRQVRVGDVMTRNPQTIRMEQLAAHAVHVMQAKKINGLLVIDAAGKLVGAFNMQDLMRAGVV